MNGKKILNEEKLIKMAINLLNAKFGPVETSRFLSITFNKRIESVKRHRIWQSKLDKEKFIKEIFS
jgi:hypothetical protein